MKEVDYSEVWRDGRLTYAYNPNICVHGVGTTPGFWCSGCNEEAWEQEVNRGTGSDD